MRQRREGRPDTQFIQTRQPDAQKREGGVGVSLASRNQDVPGSAVPQPAVAVGRNTLRLASAAPSQGRSCKDPDSGPGEALEREQKSSRFRNETMLGGSFLVSQFGLRRTTVHDVLLAPEIFAPISIPSGRPVSHPDEEVPEPSVF